MHVMQKLLLCMYMMAMRLGISQMAAETAARLTGLGWAKLDGEKTWCDVVPTCRQWTSLLLKRKSWEPVSARDIPFRKRPGGARDSIGTVLVAFLRSNSTVCQGHGAGDRLCRDVSNLQSVLKRRIGTGLT